MYYPYLYNHPFVYPYAQGPSAGIRLATGDISASAVREFGPTISARALLA